VRIDPAIAYLVRVLTGARVRWLAPPRNGTPKVYFANHTSHLDALVLWASLPAALRERTRAAAARDYWGAGRVRRFLAQRAFHAVLIERKEVRREANPLAALLEVLERGDSLILFPEGTRGDGERIGPFKGGLYHLARHRPDVELVPVHIDNLNRILPKGEFLVLPLLSCIRFGAPLALEQGESRERFLERAENAVRDLREP
jgi:1-acyl-sn-glycerol-3-phosphate acyltransferase